MLYILSFKSQWYYNSNTMAQSAVAYSKSQEPVKMIKNVFNVVEYSFYFGKYNWVFYFISYTQYVVLKIS